MCCSTWQSTFTQTQLSFKEKKKGDFYIGNGNFFWEVLITFVPLRTFEITPLEKKMDDRKMM